MKLYLILHDAREDGCGELNGKIYKTQNEARETIEEYCGYDYPTAFDDMGWTDEDEYIDTENVIYIVEREV